VVLQQEGVAQSRGEPSPSSQMSLFNGIRGPVDHFQGTPPPRAGGACPSVPTLVCEEVGGVPRARRARRVGGKAEALEHEPNRWRVGHLAEHAQPIDAPLVLANGSSTLIVAPLGPRSESSKPLVASLFH